MVDTAKPIVPNYISQRVLGEFTMGFDTAEQLRQCLELLAKIREDYPEGDFDREKQPLMTKHEKIRNIPA